MNFSNIIKNINSKPARKISSLFIALVCLAMFQNCENFGSFVAYDELSITDPHGDSWSPVDGLEVKNGEWVKVESEIIEKLRLTDRNYIASKLFAIAIQGDEDSVNNQTIRNRINSLITVNVTSFGGPCIYNNPEETPVSDNRNVSCSGVNSAQVTAQAIPDPNVYRSVLKQVVCDYLASNASVQSNIRANLEHVSDNLDSDHIPYLVHQLFYLGQEPRKRTLASLEELYKTAANNQALPPQTFNAAGLKILTLALCHSNGWEAP